MQLIAVLGVLVVTDLVLIDQDVWTILFAVLAVSALAVVARRSGLDRTDLGLSREALPAGLRWGGALSLIVLMLFVAAASVPFLASAFEDGRTPTTWPAVLAKVMLWIPLRTVLLEEFGFRGVLWGWLARAHGPRSATLWSSAAFGLWHVPPALLVLRTNEALTGVADSPTLSALVVVAGVTVTALAGVLFAELRRHTGSLAAPALLHWSVNSAGTLVGHLLR